jgi:hypothetical protein
VSGDDDLLAAHALDGAIVLIEKLTDVVESLVMQGHALDNRTGQLWSNVGRLEQQIAKDHAHLVGRFAHEQRGYVDHADGRLSDRVDVVQGAIAAFVMLPWYARWWWLVFGTVGLRWVARSTASRVDSTGETRHASPGNGTPTVADVRAPYAESTRVEGEYAKQRQADAKAVRE